MRQVGQRDAELLTQGSRQRRIADESPVQEQLPQSPPADRLVRQDLRQARFVDRVEAEEDLTEAGLVDVSFDR
jgi:hypothetical protein